MPTLILVGDKDKLAAPKNSMRLHRKMANSKMLIIPDAGHMVPVENPDAVNSAIRTFISGLKK
jgi:3-oxoadipate enol-lactonase